MRTRRTPFLLRRRAGRASHHYDRPFRPDEKAPVLGRLPRAFLVGLSAGILIGLLLAR